MNLPTSVYSYLSDTLSVGTRIYPVLLPQTVTLPALTYQVVGSVPLYAHSGDINMPTTRVQFDCWARTYDDVLELRDELVDAVSAYRGEWGEVAIEASFTDGEIDDHDRDSGLWRRIVDVLITYQEVLAAAS